MSKDYIGGFEVLTCDRINCECSQSVETCPCCGRDICYKCMGHCYDVEVGYEHDVCIDCIKENPTRFLDEPPKRLANRDIILSKLKNNEPLSDEEKSNLINWLESDGWLYNN